MRTWNRRRYLINRSVQPRYMGMVALFICIISLITGWTIYSTTWLMITERVQGEPELAQILSELNTLLIVRTAIVILAGMCVAVILTMFISHRIAGPLFRIRRTLLEIGQGGIPRKISLRQRDEFKELSEAVNSVIDKVEEISRDNAQTVENIGNLSSRCPGVEEEL